MIALHRPEKQLQVRTLVKTFGWAGIGQRREEDGDYQRDKGPVARQRFFAICDLHFRI
ncbi:MAG: hypothetical protein HY543_01475 [Deltaproteobacteria bacterium]|nr:hypothetical protein [Deltaproteobacteria bacterium]